MNTKLSKLPVDERIRLVEELWDSIASDQKGYHLPKNRRPSSTDVSTPTRPMETVVAWRPNQLRKFGASCDS